MIGRVGVLRNLGGGKLIDNPGPDPKGISWHENWDQVQGEGPQDHQGTKPEVSGLGCQVFETAQRRARVQITGRRPGTQPNGTRGAER